MAKDKMYVLVEFPYPSGSGLHIGHAFTFTGADVYARFQRMAGKDVLFPMGWDAFGLPTENYALRTGRKPQDVTQENTHIFRRQMEEMGFSFDWDRLVIPATQVTTSGRSGFSSNCSKTAWQKSRKCP
jgi:leucyl-tRNA synthetase